MSPIIAWTAVIFLIFGTILSMFPVNGPHPTSKHPFRFYGSISKLETYILLEANMNYSVVINCAVWIGSLAYYYIDARKWFTGPKITLNLDDLTEGQEKALAEEGLEVQGLPADKSASLGDSSGEEGLRGVSPDGKPGTEASAAMRKDV